MNTLPLFTGGIRNASSFVTYMPGVNSYREVSISGSGGRGKEVMIDGASLTIPESGGVVFNFPGTEMFQEFKLVTAAYSAEYGRFGGGVETYVSKSGGNDIHGAAFWYARRGYLQRQQLGEQRRGSSPTEGAVQRGWFCRRRPGLDSQGLQRTQQDLLVCHLLARHASGDHLDASPRRCRRRG
jgi:hypothetical protein